MQFAFQTSTSVLHHRSTSLLTRRKHQCHSTHPHPTRATPSSKAATPLRNIALLATAAAALNLPVPAKATAPTLTSPQPTTISATSTTRRSPVSTAIRVKSPRHVIAATPVATSAPAPATFADRIAFWAGEFLMWNPAAKVLALLAVTLMCMYLGSFLYRLADPDRKEAAFPFWHSVRAIANPLEDDWEKNSLRATSIALAGIGMIVFAILVGMVTESVESAVQNVDGFASRVVVNDHILVCGWGRHVSQILKDVGRVGTRVKVVVLAHADQKEQMMDDLRDVLSEKERGGLKVFYRPGAPLVKEDLDRVAATWAKKIVLVNTGGGNPVDEDRRVLSKALALRQNIPQFTGDIVAELNSARDEGILKSILAGTAAQSVETVNAEKLLFRFMAQAIRQPGLADVVANLMGDDPASVFHVVKAKEVAPQLVGMNYVDVRPTSIPGSVLCGFFDTSGEAHIGTGKDMLAESTTLEANTPLLLLGKKGGGSSQGASIDVPESIAQRRRLNDELDKNLGKSGAESFLVCGWREDMKDMLVELDTVLPRGSKVTILDEDTPHSLQQKYKNLSVSCVRKRPDRYENLAEFLGSTSKPYDHVVLLGSAYGLETAEKSPSGQEQDTKTLASLVYVNELLQKQYEASSSKEGKVKPAIVTVEFINERIADMAKEQGSVTNAILPQNLSAKIAAQTMRDSRLNGVWKELLSQRGREVYLRPCSSYSNLKDEHYSFAAVSDKLAQENDDIVIGYIPHDGGVVINPQGGQKFNSRPWDKRDFLIVLSVE